MKIEYLLLVGVVIVGICILYKKDSFNPIGNDICTWYVDSYDNMPPAYQDSIYSACNSYKARCSPGQMWGKIRELWETKKYDYPAILSSLMNDKCAKLAPCKETAYCIPYYTKTSCINGYCS